jgi:hypothetical protein
MTEVPPAHSPEDHPGHHVRLIPRIEAVRFSTIELLVALVLFIFISPYLGMTPQGRMIESALISVVLVLATLSIGSRRWTLVMAVVLLIPAMVARWLAHFRPDLVPPEVWPAAGILFIGFVIANLFHFILRAPRVTAEVLCAGISGYLLLGILWILAYTIVAEHSPGSFAWTVGPASSHDMRGFTAIYFSYITLCTVGYGDIVPVMPVARMLAALEAMTGTFYMAVMIARLVSLYSSRKPSG